MSDRAARREKLRQRMQQDAANRDKGTGRQPLLNLQNYEDVHWFKAKKGKNEIDILPFEITTNNDPMGAKIGEDQYKLEYWRHTNVGPKEEMVVCLLETFGKPCPICEARKQMLDAGADWKDEEVKALAPKRRCIYNVIDLNDTEKGIQLFDQSHFKFEKELFGAAEYKDPAFICFADIEEGYTVTFRGSEETFNKNKFIEPKDFDFESREPYEEDIYNDVYPLDALLIIPEYDTIQSLFLGVDTEEKEEEPEPKKETTRTARKSKVAPVEKTEAKKETPARGSRRRKAEPEPELEEDVDVLTCPNADNIGLIIGVDWDNHDVCGECPDEMYSKCEGLYKDLEKMKQKQEAEAKKAEEKEEAPARSTRRRPARRG